MLLQIFIDIVRLTPSRRRRGVQPLERHKVVAVRVLGGGRANNHGVARGCLDISPVFYPTTLSTPIYIYIFFYLVFQFFSIIGDLRNITHPSQYSLLRVLFHAKYANVKSSRALSLLPHPWSPAPRQSPAPAHKKRTPYYNKFAFMPETASE